MNQNLADEITIAKIFKGTDPYSVLRKDLEQQLYEARYEAGLTQKELAAAINGSQARVCYMETRMPHSVTLRSIFNQAEACGYELQIKLVKR